jgi:hypothetical protein
LPLRSALQNCISHLHTQTLAGRVAPDKTSMALRFVCRYVKMDQQGDHDESHA